MTTPKNVLSDEQVETLIENSGGFWREDHFVIAGSDLTDLLQNATREAANRLVWRQHVSEYATTGVSMDVVSVLRRARETLNIGRMTNNSEEHGNWSGHADMVCQQITECLRTLGEGVVVVPVAPTEEMRRAAISAMASACGYKFEAAWQAALSARPK